MYKPGSACYLKYNEKHILNTRYINYTINENENENENGKKVFTFHHPDKYIITKNIFSMLDDNFDPFFL